MKASKGTERMFEIRLMVGKPEARCDYRGRFRKARRGEGIAGTVQGAKPKRSKKAWRQL